MCRCLIALLSLSFVNLGVAQAQEALLPPAVKFDSSEVEFSWEGKPNIALQRSVDLSDWNEVIDSIGESMTTLPREGREVFYRLVRYPEGSGTLKLRLMEKRVTDMLTNQIQRAIDPLVVHDEAFGETPPDNGGGMHSVNVVGNLKPYAWASQPGMIRLFEAKPNGFLRGFKLYSSANSVLDDAEALAGESSPLLDFQSMPDRYVDLNEPLNEGDQMKFPILDPRATTQVEGLAMSQAAMPVEWLYVLEDGSLGTLNADNVWIGEEGKSASKANPIVARVAYWADDETSKLNVNTASEGVPWDQPRADTPQERNYAWVQPVRGEVQRYPGHPATISLSSVLFPGKAANHPDETKRLTDDDLALIYSLTPRVVHGGTRGGQIRTDEVITFDDDPAYTDIAEWQAAAGKDQLEGLLTTYNPAPEITIHGRPRMSIWPVEENGANRSFETSRTEELSRTGRIAYHFKRRDSSSRHAEFYSGGRRGNVNLYQMLMEQTYLKLPGYGASLAAKYGARLSESNYADDTDYDKDHHQIAALALDHIRGTNLADPFSSRRPYGANPPTMSNGFGQVSPLDLIGRNLESDTGSGQHESRWHQPTLSVATPGRLYTISEVALVAYVTAEVTLSEWRNGQPRFTSQTGPGSDADIIKRIVSNEHPSYADWIGRRYGPEDEGKIFKYVEVSLLPETFCPKEGFAPLHPAQTVRLLKGGIGYQGGVSEKGGLQINGVPLALWGDSVEAPGMEGPALFSVDPRRSNPERDLPFPWIQRGGAGGIRLMQFGSFSVPNAGEGYHGGQFLANGRGPLKGIYCQTPLIVVDDEELVIRQESPLQLALYDQGAWGSVTGSLVQLFNIRFAMPGEAVRVPAPKLNTPNYQSWTRRYQRIVRFQDDTHLDPNGAEMVKGLLPAHGDYRHIASKRHVPSELFRHHPNVESASASHSLAWAKRGGTRIEPNATFSKDLYNRSLVKGVDYSDEILPDFTFDPNERSEFAPLLGSNYRFPIDPSITRDFDNGLGNSPDGAYLNKPDDGLADVFESEEGEMLVPYFDNKQFSYDYRLSPAAHHFARRMAPSPVAMGSQPSAMQANAPWTCLLFRPNVSDPSLFPHLGERGNGMLFEKNRETLEGF